MIRHSQWLNSRPGNLINCCTEKQNKNKSKKKFVGVTEKYLKTEESLNTYDGKLFKRN